MKPQSTNETLPSGDGAALQEVLSAASTIQQHNDRLLQKGDPKQPAAVDLGSESVPVLATIVEIQNLLHNQPFDMQSAVELIAGRIQNVSQAAGVAIGFVEDKQIVYRACLGNTAEKTGAKISLDRSVSADCVRGRQVLRSSDPDHDTRLPAGLCQRKNIKSLLAVPIYHDGKIAGSVELSFATPRAFSEPEIRTCQLLAGLVTDALLRAAELEWKQKIATERAAMLDMLQRLKPQLVRLAEEQEPSPQKPAAESTQEASAVLAETKLKKPKIEETKEDLPFSLEDLLRSMPEPPESAPSASSSIDNSPKITELCQKCGHPLREEELFCGSCGNTRKAGSSPSDEKADADALAGASETAGQPSQIGELLKEFESQSEAPPISAGLPPVLEKIAAEFAGNQPAPSAKEADAEPIVEAPAAKTEVVEVPAVVPAAQKALAPTPSKNIAPAANKAEGHPWSSAITARQWLETLMQNKPGKVWLTKHRANLYLGASAILLLLVISGWGVRPHVSPAPAGMPSIHRPTTLPRPKLSLFDRALISMGLAEAPPAPAYKGNPDTQVWVDVHTALYYCPGASEYGKTTDGKLTTQRDAQEDSFEPAARKACD